MRHTASRIILVILCRLGFYCSFNADLTLPVTSANGFSNHLENETPGTEREG
ncbi:hypothetical protein VD0004_g7610 [Verticillium dahliae]|nr:hypothetical protein VD0004_g7610 [Verticillium dahliae]PNH68465.1 hypothetical protein VD0001_g7489 [Verticillium dahliae]